MRLFSPQTSFYSALLCKFWDSMGPSKSKGKVDRVFPTAEYGGSRGMAPLIFFNLGSSLWDLWGIPDFRCRVHNGRSQTRSLRQLSPIHNVTKYSQCHFNFFFLQLRFNVKPTRLPKYIFKENILFLIYCILQITIYPFRIISKSEMRKGREAGTVHRRFTAIVLLG